MDEKAFDELRTGVLGLQAFALRIHNEQRALFAVVRALTEANADNPAFLAQLKIQSEVRHVGNLNSDLPEETIDGFTKALNDLLPQRLRGS